MRRKYVALCLTIVVAFALAYFVPVVYNPPTVYCPFQGSKCLKGVPYYASLTYAYFGSGGIYLDGTYWLKLWPGQQLVS
jgi:hypothetical protein